MNKKAVCLFLLGLSAVFMPPSLFGGGKLKTNPPGCDPTQEDCGCTCDQVSADCIKVNIGLGETTPWTGSLGCSLKIFADDDSPSVFTPESLHAVLGGYTFKRLGQKTMSDGVTPAEVVLSHPNGEAVHFVFANGESLARPDPGVHIKMDARLQMVDAEGWATTHDPVYYDLYVGDGTRRRFLATNATGALGALVSITDSRGVTTTPADMGVDIVYDPDGVRQYLTPSRLANVTRTADFLGYDVAVYALQEPLQKDAATGLYVVPAGQTVEHISVRRENGGKRAVVTIRKGGGNPLRYVFDYAMGEWSLTRPSGMQERKECLIADGVGARITKTVVSSTGEVLAKKVKNYKWMSWGFAMTNRVEGFDGVTDTTTWTYYTSGNGKGQVKTEKRQSGLLIQYAYDNLDRVISKTRSGPDMMTEVTTYDYTPVDASDPVLPVDTRPRTVVRKLNNIECERTYYVYSPLTNIVERVGEQGAAYGGTSVLRTVTTYYPLMVGASLRDARSGFVASVRHEDGKLDLYDYELSSNIWVRTVTHLHEQSPLPVSGKTTRDITIANARGETTETHTEAYIDGIWYTIARNRMTYNAEGKRITSENLAGQVTTTAWDCCRKVSEVQPDGSTTTWDYDIEGRVIASSRLIPLDMTNVTWLTTCYRYDDLGRQIATWQTNYAAHVGLPVMRNSFDALDRVIARIDQLGNTTTTSYSPDGRTVFVRNPNTSTRNTTHTACGDKLSITGTAVTPEFHTYGILPDGTRWFRTVQGETANSPRSTKRYENLLGQTIREERSGFQSAVLATTHAYDSYGRLVSTVANYEPATEYTYDILGVRSASVRRADGQWRKTETAYSFATLDGSVWLTQSNIVSCSDASIAPLVSSSARQLAGLTPAFTSRSHSIDIRGNVTVIESFVDSSFVISRQTLPYATNKPLSVSRYGILLMDVSISAVTNTVSYDSLGRQIANTNGRGNTTHAEYNAVGQHSASIDALGNRTVYAYDQFGNLSAVTNPLGHAIVYEYDLRGRKTYEGGATYPVRYAYDIFGDLTTMKTYVNETNDSSGTTMWIYDESSGLLKYKIDNSGKASRRHYSPDGMLVRITSAENEVTIYAYDSWRNATNSFSSKAGASLTYGYNPIGKITSVESAGMRQSFEYGGFGELTNETLLRDGEEVSVEYFWDEFGRRSGYAINNERQATLLYDNDNGRISMMFVFDLPNPFVWQYEPGSDLKSVLQYPNGAVVFWEYDFNGNIINCTNRSGDELISRYEYSYDGCQRRVSCLHKGPVATNLSFVSYSYNQRGELIRSVDAANQTANSYDYDDCGNRVFSFEMGRVRRYMATPMNQYAAIFDSSTSCFTPTFDADGNQTSVQTSSGVWAITYDGNSRPLLLTQGVTNVVMTYDCAGRLAERLVNVGLCTNRHDTFVYDGFACVRMYYRTSHQETNDNDLGIIWEPISGRQPNALVLRQNESYFYCLGDGRGNITDIVDENGQLSWHVKYEPFGLCNDVVNLSGISNPFQYSSEFRDDVLQLDVYHMRYYNPMSGRWLTRDPAGESANANLYIYVSNDPILKRDYLGLSESGKPTVTQKECEKSGGVYSGAKCCCEGQEYFPARSCCMEVFAGFPKEVIDRGPSEVAKRHSWHFNSDDMHRSIYKMEDHVWLTWPGGSVDSNGDGRQIVHSPAITMPNSENSSGHSNGDRAISLSRCEYDFLGFWECLNRTVKRENGKHGGMCNTYVDSLVERCKAEAKLEPSL